jgi:MFS family permease
LTTHEVEVEKPVTKSPEEKLDGNAPHPSRRSLAGLDWFTFCLADVQTAFGPFVSVYLTTQKWTQIDIGLVLTVGSIATLIGQMPGGALVDAARSERRAAAIAVVGICLSALTLAVWPIFPLVLAARIIHAASSCVLVPAIAAISLGLVGHAAIGERLGRNARFASLGTGLAAAGMGASGYFFSSRAVFLVAVILTLPTLVALAQIRTEEIDPDRAHGGIDPPPPILLRQGLRRLATNVPLVIFALCTALFQFANAAILPLTGSVMTMRSSDWGPVLIATCIIVPQLVVAAISPWVGRRAESWGRRPLLIIGFAALPIRAILFAAAPDPVSLVAIQMLDGISAAVLGVLTPLVVADLARNTGHFNLAQGVVGTGVGIGAALSTTFAGYLADRHGIQVAFFGLATVAFFGFLLVALAMPETRPKITLPAN